MKKIGAIAAIAAMFGVVAWLGVQARDIRNERLEAAERRLQLPEAYLADLQGALVPLHSTGGQSVVLVFFTTTCEYCRAELHAFRRHAPLLKEHNVFFVAWEEPGAVGEFARETEIDAVPWFHVLRDTASVLGETLGIDVVPTTLVYGPDGRLREAFEGLAAIGKIAEAAAGEDRP